MARANNCCECCGLKHLSIVWASKFWIKDPESGRYKLRSIWFRNEQDAIREQPNDCYRKSVKVVLTIAHLDHDEENHDITDDRLMAMCQVCHLRYDADEKYRRLTEKVKKNSK